MIVIVALKRPSDYFKKKEDSVSVDSTIQSVSKDVNLNTFSAAFESFKSNLEKIEVLSEFSETLDNYRINIERVNHLSSRVDDVQSEIQNLLKKEDLDRAMMSQLLVVEQSITDLQNKVKGINQKNLTEIRLDVAGLTESVTEFLDVEVPKYKKLIVDSEYRTNSRYEELEENVNNTLDGIGEFVDKKYEELTSTLESINESSLSVILKEFQVLDKTVSELDVDRIKALPSKVDRELKEVEQYREDLTKKISDLEVEILRNESHIKTQNEYIENIQEELIRDVIKKIPVDKLEEKSHELNKKLNRLEEVFNKFNEREILTETIIVDPPSTKNSDPVTPLDQNFVTLQQLQEHYRIFINRVQQQLASIGGGGETRLEFLDDIDRDSAKVNGKYLRYDSSTGKWVGASAGGAGSQDLNDTLGLGNTSSLGMSVGVVTATGFVGNGSNLTGIVTSLTAGSGISINQSTGNVTISATGGAGDSYWVAAGVGIHTLSNVGVGTTNATSRLTVSGDGYFTGIVTATDFNSASDVNLKQNISVIDSPLDKVIKLQGVNFQWKESGKNSLGVIAQEVEKVLPELVSGEESKTVNYNGLIGLLIECVKQQQIEIEDLKKRIDK